MAMKKRAVEEMVEEFYPDLQQQRHLAEKLDKWVAVENDTPSMPRERTTHEYRELQSVSKSPWARLVVTEVAQSLYVEGYRGEKEKSDLWDKLWLPNQLNSRQLAVHRGALNHGMSYVVCLPGQLPMDQGRGAIIRGVSARRGIAFYRDDPFDPEDEWPTHFMSAVPTQRGRRGPIWTVTLIDEENIYTVEYDPEDRANFTYISQTAHNTGVVPVIRFANMLDLEGESMGEIEPVLPLLRRIDQDAFDRLIVQRYQSWQVRTITGMEKPGSGEQGAEMAMKMRVNDLLVAENENAKFGTLPPAPMEGLLEARVSDLRDLAAVTQSPPHHLLGLSPNVGAEGLVEAQASLQRKIEERKESFGDAWERVMRLGAHQMGMEEDAKDFTAQIRWRDTESRSLSNVADALGKMAKMLGVPPQMLWERIPDWTDQDTERAMELLSEDSEEQELLQRMTHGIEPEPEFEGGAVRGNKPQGSQAGVQLDPEMLKERPGQQERGPNGTWV